MEKFLKLRIDEKTYKEFQKVCKNKGKTMSNILRNFIILYIDKNEKTKWRILKNLIKKIW